MKFEGGRVIVRLNPHDPESKWKSIKPNNLSLRPDADTSCAPAHGGSIPPEVPSTVRNSHLTWNDYIDDPELFDPNSNFYQGVPKNTLGPRSDFSRDTPHDCRVAPGSSSARSASHGAATCSSTTGATGAMRTTTTSDPFLRMVHASTSAAPHPAKERDEGEEEANFNSEMRRAFVASRISHLQEELRRLQAESAGGEAGEAELRQAVEASETESVRRLAAGAALRPPQAPDAAERQRRQVQPSPPPARHHTRRQGTSAGKGTCRNFDQPLRRDAPRESHRSLKARALPVPTPPTAPPALGLTQEQRDLWAQRLSFGAELSGQADQNLEVGVEEGQAEIIDTDAEDAVEMADAPPAGAASTGRTITGPDGAADAPSHALMGPPCAPASTSSPSAGPGAGPDNLAAVEDLTGSWLDEVDDVQEDLAGRREEDAPPMGPLAASGSPSSSSAGPDGAADAPSQALMGPPGAPASTSSPSAGLSDPPSSSRPMAVGGAGGLSRQVSSPLPPSGAPGPDNFDTFEQFEDDDEEAHKKETTEKKVIVAPAAGRCRRQPLPAAGTAAAGRRDRLRRAIEPVGKAAPPTKRPRRPF